MGVDPCDGLCIIPVKEEEEEEDDDDDDVSNQLITK